MEVDEEEIQNEQYIEEFSFEKHKTKRKIKKSIKKRKKKDDKITKEKEEKIEKIKEEKKEKEDKTTKENEEKNEENKEEKSKEKKEEKKDDKKEDEKKEKKEKIKEEKKEEIKIEKKEEINQDKKEDIKKDKKEEIREDKKEEKKEDKKEVNKEEQKEDKKEIKKAEMTKKVEKIKENTSSEKKKLEDKKENKEEKKEKKDIKEKNNEKKEKEKTSEKTEKVKEDEKKKKKEQPIKYEAPIYNSKISEFELINQDHSLKSFEWCIKRRNEHFKNQLRQIESNEGSLENFANSYKKMGLHLLPNNDIQYREYAPGAKGIALFGEFNNWKRDEYWAERDKYGFWNLIIPNDNGQPRIKHETKVKSNVVLSNGNWVDRNPIWIEFLYQNPNSLIFDGVFWNPEPKYVWKYPKTHLSKPRSLRIYEAHIGMSSFDPKVSTYLEFADNILPRIKKTGYTAVQLMAIMHHANYASFGYHVNNFFAVSSRFGKPEELMYLIDKAHELGLFMIMDIVHSHASSNVDDGFNLWDGTDYLYFHGGKMGHHSLWDSRLFNYSSYETLRFLLSNCAYYSEKFHFDGFRFDGITSILYRNHGIRYSFSGDYNEYFSDNFDEDGGVYLMLANKLLHEINPDVITIAEDVSGMPGLCLTVEQGGFGFDYRLNMSVSDKWIQLLKEYKDEDWNLGNLVFTLTNRRYNEKHVGYCESHDQSIVGDKTIAMWLFDKEMYWNMSCNSPETIIISRGMALHKLIRLITLSLGGEAFLCFMGNEFGHPEWVDFPRPGNGFSYAHCRRRWDLCDNKSLRYKYLYNWDVAINKLDDVFNFISSPFQYISLKHEDDKIIVFEKGDLLFVFNFHSYKSYENYKIGTKWGTQHKIVLDSDEFRFFGKGRLEYGHGHFFPIIREGWNNRPNHFNLYIPSRTCMVLIAEENLKKYDLSKFTFETIE
jgi:1,4-alpha-glucan branching enzyme